MKENAFNHLLNLKQVTFLQDSISWQCIVLVKLLLYIYILFHVAVVFEKKKILCESCNLWFVWLLNNQVLIQRLTILVSVHYQLFKKDFFAVKVNTMQYLLASGWNFLKLEASNCHLLGVFSNESLNRNDYFCSVVGSV